jgi:hypothetical protein
MGSAVTGDRIYSAGGCAVCASAGAAIFVKDVASGALFFACPECGCAWRGVPTVGLADTVDSPSHFAPAGFAVASRMDIDLAGLGDLVRHEQTADLESIFLGVAGFCGR